MKLSSKTIQIVSLCLTSFVAVYTSIHELLSSITVSTQVFKRARTICFDGDPVNLQLYSFVVHNDSW